MATKTSDRMTVPRFSGHKVIGKNKNDTSPLVVVTAYDYTFARIVEEAGVDAVLVGDSLGMVVQGNSTTLPVTLEQMIYHTQCVTRGTKNALVIADMPFLSYQPSEKIAIESAGRLLKEGGASAVKLEGGLSVANIVRRMVDFDIPVMGHIGLTPQSVHRMGGYKVQGRKSAKLGSGIRAAQKIMDDALALEDAGAFSIVIECVPEELAKKISERLTIPTIGIGSGVNCDGQVLVIYDLLGMISDVRPTFVKRFVEGAEIITKAVASYGKEVRTKKFPGNSHSFKDNK